MKYDDDDDDPVVRWPSEVAEVKDIGRQAESGGTFDHGHGDDHQGFSQMRRMEGGKSYLLWTIFEGGKFICFVS